MPAAPFVRSGIKEISGVRGCYISALARMQVPKNCSVAARHVNSPAARKRFLAHFQRVQAGRARSSSSTPAPESPTTSSGPATG